VELAAGVVPAHGLRARAAQHAAGGRGVQRQRLRQARGGAALDGLGAARARGEKLFQANCAFCHGGDGTGKNWIGQFMEPKARDLTAIHAVRHAAPRGCARSSAKACPAPRCRPGSTCLDALAAFVQRALFRGGDAVAGAPR
jgi:mono/diheme cytochrome c family protein